MKRITNGFKRIGLDFKTMYNCIRYLNNIITYEEYLLVDQELRAELEKINKG